MNKLIGLILTSSIYVWLCSYFSVPVTVASFGFALMILGWFVLGKRQLHVGPWRRIFFALQIIVCTFIPQIVLSKGTDVKSVILLIVWIIVVCISLLAIFNKKIELFYQDFVIILMLFLLIMFLVSGLSIGGFLILKFAFG